MKQLLFLLLIQGIFMFSRAISGVIWNKDKESFVPIFSVASFSVIQQGYIKKTRELEIHDFQGRNVSFTYFEEKNMVDFKAHGKVSGIAGEIWTLLADLLNFRLKPLKWRDRTMGMLAKNGSFTGLLGHLAQNKIDVLAKTELYTKRTTIMQFTVPMWQSTYRLYIRREQKHDETWILRLFTWKVWCVTLIMHLLLSMCSFVSQNCIARINNTIERISFSEHFFYNFAMMCNQSYIPDTFRGRSRIIEFSLGLFSSILYIAFCALLFTHITRKIFIPPFTDVTSLLDTTNYDIVVTDGSIGHVLFQKPVVAEFTRVSQVRRYNVVDTVEEMYENACSRKKKYAMFESEDAKKARGTVICRLNPTGKRYFRTWISSGVARNFTYKKSFDIGILRLHEVGLIDILKERWMESMNVEEEESQMPEPIGMDQVSIIFGTLCFGIFMAFVILLIENISFRCQ